MPQKQFLDVVLSFPKRDSMHCTRSEFILVSFRSGSLVATSDREDSCSAMAESMAAAAEVKVSPETELDSLSAGVTVPHR